MADGRIAEHGTHAELVQQDGLYRRFTAIREQADVLLCGHTHIPYYDDFGSLQLLNPGSIGYGHTYGVITIQRGTAVCCVKTLE